MIQYRPPSAKSARIDCNLPYEEAMTEFVIQKINFPFELSIRRSFLRRHRSMLSLKMMIILIVSIDN